MVLRPTVQLISVTHSQGDLCYSWDRSRSRSRSWVHLPPAAGHRMCLVIRHNVFVTSPASPAAPASACPLTEGGSCYRYCPLVMLSAFPYQSNQQCVASRDTSDYILTQRFRDYQRIRSLLPSPFSAVIFLLINYQLCISTDISEITHKCHQNYSSNSWILRLPPNIFPPAYLR